MLMRRVVVLEVSGLMAMGMGARGSGEELELEVEEGGGRGGGGLLVVLLCESYFFLERRLCIKSLLSVGFFLLGPFRGLLSI